MYLLNHRDKEIYVFMSRSQATEDTEPAAYFMRSPLRTLNALAFKLFINIKTLFLLISVVQKNKKNHEHLHYMVYMEIQIFI